MECEKVWLEHRLTREDIVGAFLACAICIGVGVLAATYFDLKPKLSSFERGMQPNVRAAYVLGPIR
jgi:hypothetical protein